MRSGPREIPRARIRGVCSTTSQGLSFWGTPCWNSSGLSTRKLSLFWAHHSGFFSHGTEALTTVHILLFALATRRLRIPNLSPSTNVTGICLFLPLTLTLFPYPDTPFTQISPFIYFSHFSIAITSKVSHLNLSWNKVEYYTFLTSLEVASEFKLEGEILES